MAEKEGFGDRVFRAHLHLSAELKRKVENKDVAIWVGKELGRDGLSPSTVGRWHEGTEPDLATIRAMAVVYRVDPGWLAFGDDSDASSPESPAAQRSVPVPPRGENRRGGEG